MTRLVIVDLI